MSQRHVIIIGGGLTGLSAGCYARASGFRTTIVEHNIALGGVCTAWNRGPYVIDGCIQWLTGGPFEKLYEELGILSRVRLQTIRDFLTYRDTRDGTEVTISSDLDATAGMLRRLAPEDAEEIQKIVEGARRIAGFDPGVDRPSELTTIREQLAGLWNMRHELGTIAHFRKPMKAWSEDHIRNSRLRGLLGRMIPGEAPALFLLMMLGYLEKGLLSRPIGGTARFRDALVDAYRERGGEVLLHSTVDEVLLDGNRATGVRLADGTILDADIVISTASAPETVLRLLGGRYGARETRDRLERWTLFQPIVIASFGVAAPMKDVPSTLILDHVEPFMTGNVLTEHLHVRVYNDDESFAPQGHTVVQALLGTDYDFWAKSGSGYTTEKDALAAVVQARLSVHLPGMSGAVRVSDVATPLTFWNMARSWRGAFEGWMPSPDDGFIHLKKVLPPLSGFYMAGQWVEPGGGIPMAVMSGHQVVQLLCAHHDRPFVSSLRGAVPAVSP